MSLEEEASVKNKKIRGLSMSNRNRLAAAFCALAFSTATLADNVRGEKLNEKLAEIFSN